MGNKKSVPETSDPYEVLGVDRKATPQEIRRKYTEMLLKYHPTRNKNSSDLKVIQIKSAYQSIVENRAKAVPEAVEIDLSGYTEDYFKGLRAEFYDTVANLFDMLCRGEPKASYPKFGSKDSKNFDAFYGFFRKFRTQRVMLQNKHENRVLQKDFNAQIRKIVEIIARHDRRLETVITEKPVFETYAVKEKKRRAKRTGLEFECKVCDKGFRTKNQAVCHLRSRKHEEKVMATETDYRSHIEKEIRDITDRDVEKKRLDGAEEALTESDEQQAKVIRENEKVLYDLYARVEKIDLEVEHTRERVPAKREDAPKPKKVRKTTKKGDATKTRRKVKKSAPDFIQGESIHFLTCTTCKTVFESRNKLFLHLRGHHLP